jgi:hypothetical protein
MKLKKAQIKALPAKISEHVLALQARYRTRNCDLECKESGWELYLGEGAKYFCLRPDGDVSSVQMQSERTLHAGGGWRSHQVGKRIPLPKGTWIVEFELFLGKPFIRVLHVGEYIPAGG